MASTPNDTAGTPGTPAAAATVNPTASAPPVPREIRVYAHSMLFYWWPVWLAGYIFGLWTYFEGHRLLIVPAAKSSKLERKVDEGPDGKSVGTITYTMTIDSKKDTASLRQAAEASQDPAHSESIFGPRMSEKSWLGSIFVIVLMLIVFSTNVPLRGLWSYLLVAGVLILGLILQQFGVLGKVLSFLGDLDIYINMGGYFTIATVVLVLWVLSTFIFDRRRYMIFTPGQVRVCEEIGEAEKVYETTGLMTERFRDDFFRHRLLGFGTGDLVVRTSGAERAEHRLDNVWDIDNKLAMIQRMLRERKVVAS
jgi:hypothetical protein